MRPFYTTKNSSPFFKNLPYTFAVHKDYVEIIWRIDAGQFGISIANMFLASNDELGICCYWNRFFECVKTKYGDVGELLRKIEKKCPTLVKLYGGEIPGIHLVELITGDKVVMKTVKADIHRSLPELLATLGVLNVAGDVINILLKMWQEIVKNCTIKKLVADAREVLS